MHWINTSLTEVLLDIVKINLSSVYDIHVMLNDMAYLQRHTFLFVVCLNNVNLLCYPSTSGMWLYNKHTKLLFTIVLTKVAGYISHYLFVDMDILK